MRAFAILRGPPARPRERSGISLLRKYRGRVLNEVQVSAGGQLRPLPLRHRCLVLPLPPLACAAAPLPTALAPRWTRPDARLAAPAPQIRELWRIYNADLDEKIDAEEFALFVEDIHELLFGNRLVRRQRSRALRTRTPPCRLELRACACARSREQCAPSPPDCARCRCRMRR